MYTITEERANELMLMELTVRLECEKINASLGGNGHDVWQKHVDVASELVDVQMDEGIVATFCKIQDMSARYREKGDRTGLSVVLMLRTLGSIADMLVRGIER